MYFFVDESGHTGAHLFDPDQPMLYYGVLSSRLNVDLLARDAVLAMRQSCGVDRLHAAHLGNAKLPSIMGAFLGIQRRLDLRFDLYRIAKPDHAVICFFDQVFDHGVNPAVTWTGYWTPLRYVLLLKVASLFDEDLARIAWEARIELNDARAETRLVEVCQILRERAHRLPDARSRQLIGDTLAFAEKFPAKILYNVKSKEMLLQVTPNIVGFQQVMIGIATRIRKHRRDASRIVIDQQTQFNGAQKILAGMYASASKVRTPLLNGPGLPKLDFRDIPDTPLSFVAGTDSHGLELVDLYIWIFKRAMERKELAPELYGVISSQMHRGRTDEISINGIAERWTKYYENLPELSEMSEERVKSGAEILRVDEERRLKALRDAKLIE